MNTICSSCLQMSLHGFVKVVTCISRQTKRGKIWPRFQIMLELLLLLLNWSDSGCWKYWLCNTCLWCGHYFPAWQFTIVSERSILRLWQYCMMNWRSWSLNKGCCSKSIQLSIRLKHTQYLDPFFVWQYLMEESEVCWAMNVTA